MENLRYLVFAGNTYYANGGWEDFKGSFPTQEKALRFAATIDSVDWWQIVDLEAKLIVDHDTRKQVTLDTIQELDYHLPLLKKP